MDEFSNPFEEEFDSVDVINKSEIDSGIASKSIETKKDPEFLKNELTNDDLDKIINYDQEKRKKKNFSNRINDEIELTDSEIDLENNFKDFLVAPKISGRSSLKGDAHIFPQSKVVRSDKVVEITSTPSDKTRKHDKASVLINRDERGDVENIEIVCACGEMILLKFDSEDNLNDESTKIVSKKIEEPVPFSKETEFEDIESGLLTDNEKIEEFETEDIFEDFADIQKNEANENINSSIANTNDEIVWDDDFGSGEDLDTGDIDLSGI